MANVTQRQTSGLYELTDSAREELKGSSYYNEDLAPTSVASRTWGTYNISALWIGMAVSIPAFTMASGLVQMGFSPWWAVFNVTLGNLLVLIPIQLNSHAGTKYGIPFPIFSRLTFGMRGAHIPSISRAIAACGWNAIQCWIGGGAVVALIGLIVPGFGGEFSHVFIGFLVFLALNIWLTISGHEKIKVFESLSAPLLALLCIGVLVWSTALATSYGFSVGQVLSAPSNFDLLAQNGGAALVFMIGLTANIGFWGTMAINIPDFSRYAKSQKDQFRGQLYGMPIFMLGCAFIGAYMAQATTLAWGAAIFNPMLILGHIDSGIIVFIVSLGVIVATATTNIAANIIAPANGFSNLNPKRISYRTGIIITGLTAVLFQPWHLMGGAAALFNAFIGTYGGMLAPLAAIFVADYYMVKKCRVDVSSLFKGESGRYWYSNGFNSRAVIAWVAGFILPTIGRIMAVAAGGGAGGAQVINNAFFRYITANAYIFGFVVALVVYVIIMDKSHLSFVSAEEENTITSTTA